MLDAVVVRDYRGFSIVPSNHFRHHHLLEELKEEEQQRQPPEEELELAEEAVPGQ